MPNRSPHLHILTGPTAVGKTQYALEWAQAHQAHILSCDSLLVYQGMDIGTAKPTLIERAQVPHHLIDCVPATQPFSVQDYVNRALLAAQQILQTGHSILVTGGAGFYLKAFFEPVTDHVFIPEAVHTCVQELYQQRGNQGIVEALQVRNPEGLGTLDLHNPRRTVNALKRCLASGQTLRTLKASFESQLSPFAAYTQSVTLLERPVMELNQRIEARVWAMLEAGLIEEVKALKEQGLELNPSAACAIGYRETLAWLSAPTSLSALAGAMIQNTQKLAKKQRTWFRHQLPTPTVTVVRL